MTTLIEIAQSIAEETGFEPVPTSIIGNSDETAKRLLRSIRRAGEMTARRHNWTILQREHTFQTVPTIDTYTLPSDFRYLLEQSAWNRTDFWQMRGSLSARDWQIRRSALGNQVGIRDRFRLHNGDLANTIRIDPRPIDVEDLVLEYVTKNWIGAAFDKAQFTADNDEPAIDAWLVEMGGLWHFQRSVGKPYLDEMADWERECNRAFTRDGLPPSVDLSRDPVLAGGKPVASVPDTGIGI